MAALALLSEGSVRLRGERELMNEVNPKDPNASSTLSDDPSVSALDHHGTRSPRGRGGGSAEGPGAARAVQARRGATLRALRGPARARPRGNGDGAGGLRRRARPPGGPQAAPPPQEPGSGPAAAARGPGPGAAVPSQRGPGLRGERGRRPSPSWPWSWSAARRSPSGGPSLPAPDWRRCVEVYLGRAAGWPRSTPPGWCTETSSRATASSTRTGALGSSTSGWWYAPTRRRPRRSSPSPGWSNPETTP